MSRAGTPIVLDSWLSLLSKLNTETVTVGSRLVNSRGRRYQPSAFLYLKDFGIIQSTHAGYRLSEPLSVTPFSTLVDLWTMSEKSYIRRLFLRYGDLSVEAVNGLPTPPLTSSVCSFDNVMYVIHSLRYNKYVKVDEFYSSRCCNVYRSMIAHQLALLGLVTNRPRGGYCLLKRHSEIRIRDIVPAVSTKCQTLSKILLLAQDEPVSRFFR